VIALEDVSLDRPLGEAGMKEALQSALILVLWVFFWLAGTLGGAVLQAWLIDIGFCPISICRGSSRSVLASSASSAGAYAAVKLGDLALKHK
jgi:hypothetical protein